MLQKADQGAKDSTEENAKQQSGEEVDEEDEQPGSTAVCLLHVVCVLLACCEVVPLPVCSNYGSHPLRCGLTDVFRM